MANTYIQIGSTVTVGGGGAATIAFTSIPATFTDLKVVYSARTTDSASWNVAYVKFNTDTTAANYPTRYLFAFSTTVGSGTANQFAGYLTSTAMTSSTFANNEIYVPNYLSSTQKSFSVDSVTEGNSATLIPSQLTAGIWTDTSAINQITLTPDAGNFAEYSTATLYGISKS